MPYKYIIHRDALLGNDAAVARDLEDKISQQLDVFMADPVGLARKARCPPFPPVGYQHDFRLVDSDGKHYNVVLFFLFSDNSGQIDIYRILIQPMFRN